MKFLKRNPPDLPIEVLEDLLRTHYGLEGELTALESERDQSLRVATGDRSYLLKVSNVDEDPEVVDLQISALKHIERVDPTLSVPRALPTVTGADSCQVAGPKGANHQARLLSYIDGVVADRPEFDTAEFRHHTGVVLARLDVALHGFSHPAANQGHPWDLMSVSRLLDLVGHISDESARRYVVVILERARDHTVPTCLGLRHQVIHQDAHNSNLVVDPKHPAEIAGVIDFGDVVDGPLVSEIAVAAHFSGRPQATPETLIDIVLGYNSVTPLEPAEIEVVYDLALARLAMSTTIMAARAALFPDEHPYGSDQEFLSNRIASYAEAGPEITEQIRRELGFSRPLTTTG